MTRELFSRILNLMVKLDLVFAALADPTRRSIVARLTDGDATVGELAAPFAMSLPAVSKHVRVLEAGGLVRRRKQGRAYVCTLRRGALDEATRWMLTQHGFWERRFESLDDVFKGR